MSAPKKKKKEKPKSNPIQNPPKTNKREDDRDDNKQTKEPPIPKKFRDRTTNKQILRKTS